MLFRSLFSPRSLDVDVVLDLMIHDVDIVLALTGTGPQEIRAFRPGKVIKVLVAAGDEVRAGASLIVVEAMKMQSEMKAPKDGRITKIHAVEGATVGAGEPLIGIE